ncbi:MAG: AraC family transcriptional regulator [Bacteroidales bacterium]|jgi:AraC family transcriptional regulator|nr:AraC family transcriptional regulator [Bacteroidales bacterium]MDX9927004.1 AraC family transcriptional regulator [Bacteroidales bacterium]HNX83757.1 AraC family transcriptional regulator [Bacteroidales bacterium]HOC47573.1 AraC family transcriptional regulator [Bacteroidales bacterium]HPS97374.1 AraC family transcriptional regulator [Bacteroidales bacterium]
MDEPKTSRSEYISRINKTLDYIDSNIENLMTLGELASVANFSKYHFNRIFHSIVGETPFQFIQRVKIEKAAMLLLTNRKMTVSGIATKCGFSDLSVFSRNFKSCFGVSPTSYRANKPQNSNLSQTVSKGSQAEAKAVPYFCPELQTIKWRTNMKLNKSVEVKELPKMTLAYIRHIGPYKGDDKLFEGLWNSLFAWAGPRGLIGGKGFRSLVIYHDDPGVTIEDKLRMSVCITVPPETKVDGEIGKMELEAAKYVIARFEVNAQQFQEAWDWLYGEWFPASGYQPDEKPCFEMYPEEPRDGKFVVDICVPVKPI